MINRDTSATITVWDKTVRLLHWSLVVAIALAWSSTLVWAPTALHEPAGYLAGFIVMLRLLWGFIGSRHARFRQFIHSPARVWRYLQQLTAHCEPRYLGHNPLGGWMVILLLTTVMITALSGWLFTTDRFWGIAWVQQLHAASAWVLLALIAVHIGGVVFTSIRQRENLISAMFSGRKRES